MMNLLISVKNAEEALIALEASVDMLDLKNPNVGALGALDLKTTEQILQEIQRYQALTFHQSQPLISATVGENHTDLDTLVKEIDKRIKMGIDIIKIATSDVCRNNVLKTLSAQARQVKLVAVFFADESMDLTWLEKFKNGGFYAAMIDTHTKQQNLFEICSISNLQNFVQKCQKIGLKAGIAGSLKPQHIENLVAINPSYIGFRGGVCTDNLRNSSLMVEKIINLKKLLQEHNKFNDLEHFS
ncbi:MAG: (5-formylfuran-3-yl)methyl phosphate synthase [Pseudomonadota bacterium]